MQSEYRVQEGEKSAENVISVLVENISFFFFSLEIFPGALDMYLEFLSGGMYPSIWLEKSHFSFSRLTHFQK